MGAAKNIYVTEQDMGRLERMLAASSRTPNIEALEEELSRAVTVPEEQLPLHVVRMNSQVRFKDSSTGEESDVTLVYPQDAKVEEGKVSILAPVGSALIGLSVGEEIEWPMPNGKIRKLQIVSVHFEP